jgi:hypothetical protein
VACAGTPSAWSVHEHADALNWADHAFPWSSLPRSAILARLDNLEVRFQEEHVQVKPIISAVLLAAGALSAGCGGTEADMEAQSNLQSREDEQTVWCTNKAWEVRFYSDPALTLHVGTIRCACYQAQFRSGDTSTPYYKLMYERTCSFE